MNKERESLIIHKAYKLWEEDGKPGYWFGVKSDYYTSKAIEKLNSEKKKLHNYVLEPFITAEKQLEKLLAFLKGLVVLEILGILGNITIIIALISYIITEEQRRNAEVYQAWQVITSAYEQTGSGGRIKALEFLNSQPRRFPLFWLKWERESLAGLAAPAVYLPGIELQEAFLFRANLQQAYLEGSNLQKADLRFANLQKAYLGGANLQNADLRFANLQEAYLEGANNLTYKQIKSACFWERAIYKGEFDFEQLAGVAIEPNNTEFIEELKKDISSNPEESIDCTRWENK